MIEVNLVFSPIGFLILIVRHLYLSGSQLLPHFVPDSCIWWPWWSPDLFCLERSAAFWVVVVVVFKEFRNWNKEIKLCFFIMSAKEVMFSCIWGNTIAHLSSSLNTDRNSIYDIIASPVDQYLGWSCWTGSGRTSWGCENAPSCWPGSPRRDRSTGPGWCSLSPPPGPKGRRSDWWCSPPGWIAACVRPASGGSEEGSRKQQVGLIRWRDTNECSEPKRWSRWARTDVSIRKTLPFQNKKK